MKICIKRIYCANCQKLVSCQADESNGTVKVTCPRCKNLLRLWDGVAWLPVEKKV